MRRFFRIFVSLAAACAVTLFTGCSDNDVLRKSNEVAWDFANVEPSKVTKWPENEYTTQIIKPENGEIDSIYDYSDFGRYAVFIKDISEKEYADYIEALKKQGYSEMASEGNEVSVGTILRKDPVFLSISYSGTMLGILITIESAA